MVHRVSLPWGMRSPFGSRLPRFGQLLLLCFLAPPAPLASQDTTRSYSGLVGVRYSEGTVHGFLELRSEDDSVLAHGDLLQVPGDSGLESRMVFHFRDQSFFEETTRFTQHRVFRMQWYHLVQRGPAFEQDLDATLSIDGHYLVKTVSHKDGKEERYEGTLDLPEDTYNGLPVVLAKNLKSGDTALVHLVAFTPKPRLIGLEISFVAASSVLMGGRQESALHFRLKPKLGALTALFAKLLGKLPSDSHVWVVSEDVPAFIHFIGPLYSGPSWQLSLTTPSWPKRPPSD